MDHTVRTEFPYRAPDGNYAVLISFLEEVLGKSISKDISWKEEEEPYAFRKRTADISQNDANIVVTIDDRFGGRYDGHLSSRTSLDYSDQQDRSLHLMHKRSSDWTALIEAKGDADWIDRVKQTSLKELN